jgi:hypothetical protein
MILNANFPIGMVMITESPELSLLGLSITGHTPIVLLTFHFPIWLIIHGIGQSTITGDVAPWALIENFFLPALHGI